MKVTPLKKKFGKYKPGDVFDFPDKPAKVFIKIGKLEQVRFVDAPALTYSTRMMTADPPYKVSQYHDIAEDEQIGPHVGPYVDPGAPYGYKADGTPRKRPGRTKASE